MKKFFTLFTAVLVAFSATAANVTVAEGTTENTKLPVNGYYCDVLENHTQVIYPAADLTTVQGHNISALTFYAKSSAISWGAAEFVVKVAEVEDASLSGFLTPSFTEVFAGKLAIASSFLEITFATPFAYTGKNLLIDISQTKQSSYSDANEPTFYGVEADGAGYGSKTGKWGTADVVNFRPQLTITHDGGGAVGTCDKPTKLSGIATPDGAVFTWTADEGAQHQYCVVAKDAEPAEWMLLGADKFTCTITGKTLDTEYDFCLRTYCSETLQSEVVHQSFTPVCNAPENVQLTGLEAHAARVEWSAVTGVSKYQFVCIEAGEELSWEGVEPKAGLSATFTELYDDTEYEFYVRSYFSETVQSKAVKLSFTTDCDAKKLPYRVVFRNENLPACWAIANRSSAGFSVVSLDETNYFMRFNSRQNGFVDTLIVPTVNLAEDAILKMEMSNTTGLKVHLMVSTDGGKTRALLADLSEATEESIEKTIDLSSHRGETNLYFYATGDNKSHYFDFSTFQIIAKPCSTPQELTADPSSTGAVITWNAGNDESAWNLRYKAVSASAWTTVNDLNARTYTLTELTSGTEYEVQVQSACAADKLSEWTSSVKFTPECPVPFHLTFPTVSVTSAVVVWESTENAFKLQYKEADAAEWSEAISVNAKTYTLSGLTANTTYAVQIQSSCGSEYVSGKFTTRCAGLTVTSLPFKEDFEAVAVETLPDCWFILPEGAQGSVLAMNDDGNHRLYLAEQTERWVVLPAFEADLTDYSLLFDLSGNCKIEVGYLTEANGAAFVALQEVSTPAAQCDLKNLSAAAHFLAIHYVATSSWSDAYIDNVQIVESDTLTGIEEIANGKCPNGKFIMDGQLIIEHNGHRYNAQGTILK